MSRRGTEEILYRNSPAQSTWQLYTAAKSLKTLFRSNTLLESRRFAPPFSFLTLTPKKPLKTLKTQNPNYRLKHYTRQNSYHLYRSRIYIPRVARLRSTTTTFNVKNTPRLSNYRFKHCIHENAQHLPRSRTKTSRVSQTTVLNTILAKTLI